MKSLYPLIAALGLTFSFGMAHAADKEKTPQQQKMATCSSAAKGKKGDEYKAAVKTCLSADAPAAAADDGMTKQQSKMKTCNADPKAKELKGAERKAFMSSCLKG
jgi:hypothetical protein